LPTRPCAAQPAGALERLEHLTQALILDHRPIAELRPRAHDACGQDVEHLLPESAPLAVLVSRDDLQVDHLRVRRDELAELPRMADYAVWGEAVARGLGWGTETFARTYKENRREAAEVMLEDSPLAEALLQVARSEPGLVTPVSKLHARLTRNSGTRIAASAGWPKTAAMLARELRKIAPQLRLQGLSITFEPRYDGHYVGLTWEPAPASQQTHPTAKPETI
jgi:hypothetical protein